MIWKSLITYGQLSNIILLLGLLIVLIVLAVVILAKIGSLK